MYYNRVKYELTHKGAPLEVEEPLEWAEDEKSFIRTQYHGINVTLSDKLSFVGEAYELLLSIVTTYGLNEDVKLTRWVKNPQTDIWEVDYVGWIDLLTFEATDTRFTVKFNADPDVTRFKSKQSAKIELERRDDLYGNDIGALSETELWLDGRNILLSSKLASPDDDNTIYFDYGNGRSYQTIPVYVKELNERNDGVIQVASVLDETPKTSNTPGTLERSIVYPNQVEATTIQFFVTINNSFQPYFEGVTNISIQLQIHVYQGVQQIFNRAIRVSDELYFNGNPDDFPSYWNHSSASIPVDLALDESCALLWVIETEGSSDRKWTIASFQFTLGGTDNPKFFNKETGQWEDSFYEAKVTVQEDSDREGSFCKSIKAFDYAERINTIVLGTEFKSDLLSTGDMAETCFTHGMWIRGLQGSDKFKALSTTYKDFYDSLDVVYPIGMAIQNGVTRIEDREYFYQNFTGLRLGEVDDLVLTPDEKSYNSTITVGYKKSGGYEEDSGLDEFNRETEYDTIIDKTDNVLTMISKYRADGYGLETIRRENPEVDQTADPDRDSKFDDDIWILDVKPTDGVNWELKVWEERFAKAPTNVYSPETVINLWYSPINILLRHGSWLKSSLTKYLDSSIKFLSSEGNSGVETQLIDGNPYRQDGEIPVDDLDRSQNQAIKAKFTAPISWAELNGTSYGIPNVYGMVAFTYLDATYKGHIMAVKLNNGIGTFDVIITTSTSATSNYVEPEPEELQIPTGITLREI